MRGGLARSARTAILAVSIALAVLFIALTVMQALPYEINADLQSQLASLSS